MADIERQTIGGASYVVIVQQDEGGYEWATVALIRRESTGQLFLVTESGCSCNSPWESTMPDDLEPVASWQEAVARLQDDVRDFTADEVARFAEKLAELRPEPSSRAAADPDRLWPVGTDPDRLWR